MVGCGQVTAFVPASWRYSVFITGMARLGCRVGDVETWKGKGAWGGVVNPFAHVI